MSRGRTAYGVPECRRFVDARESGSAVEKTKPESGEDDDETAERAREEKSLDVSDLNENRCRLRRKTARGELRGVMAGLEKTEAVDPTEEAAEE